MYLIRQINNINTYLILMLIAVSITGDYIVKVTKLHVFQAIFDNATHAMIGALSWAIVTLNTRNFNGYSHSAMLIEIASCAILSSVIDLDHFVVARSLSLKDATNLKSRPPLHCSTFPALACIAGLFVSYFLQWDIGKRFALIILTAFMSHHTRDATRRGYWFYPWGSTKPIPYFGYVGLTCLIPFVVSWVHVNLRTAKHVATGAKDTVIL